MKTYVILLRGINVGGKNIVPMAGPEKMPGRAGLCRCFNLSWATTIKLLEILKDLDAR
jgi:uncharacterized protein (DUF1697 family)